MVKESVQQILDPYDLGFPLRIHTVSPSESCQVYLPLTVDYVQNCFVFVGDDSVVNVYYDRKSRSNEKAWIKMVVCLESVAF